MIVFISNTAAMSRDTTRAAYVAGMELMQLRDVLLKGYRIYEMGKGQFGLLKTVEDSDVQYTLVMSGSPVEVAAMAKLLTA